VNQQPCTGFIAALISEFGLMDFLVILLKINGMQLGFALMGLSCMLR